VVVDDVEDFGDGLVGEFDMGDVGLPALVGEFGDEPDVGAARPFVGLRGDEPAGFEDTPDRRHRRDRDVGAGEMGVDGLGAGVEAGFVEPFADRDDLFLEEVADPGR
jgi:hypothetical protein